MGEVYLARDLQLGRPAALKLLPAVAVSDPRRARRFAEQARAAAALNHPNIVTICEVGQAGALHFIAAEFVGGATPREHMAGGRMAAGGLIFQSGAGFH